MTRRPATPTALTALLAVLLLLTPTTASASPAPTSPAAPAAAPVLASTLSGPAAEILHLVNQARAAEGLRPLVADAEVTVVAQRWSERQARAQRMYHNPDYASQIPSGWSRAGENVAMGYRTAAAMHEGWMNSPGHRANILNAAFTHIGIGWAVDANGRPYGTQLFAAYPAGARPDPEPTSRFWDVPRSHPFHDEVEWGAARGIVAGYQDGSFRPRSTVSREAMAAFLYRSITGRSQVPACSGGSRAFSDVPATHPFCGAIEWLAANGYAAGYADGTYRPGVRMSRQAMAAFLHRANGLPAAACSGTRFRDVGPDNTFCGAIEWMARTGLTTGYGDGTFRPAQGVARDATAAFLYRAR